MLTQVRKRLPLPLKRRVWLTRLFLRSLTASQRMSPAFIIIGAQKGGTTSLYHYLVQHPQIFPSLEKEVRFFDYKFDKGLAWYRAHFPLKLTVCILQKRNGRSFITGEASPNYLFDPRPPQRIADTLPNAKLIVMLRNPIDRAYSSYQMGMRRGWETLPFAEAIAIEEERTAGELEKSINDPHYIGYNRHNFAYLARGRYAEQLTSWLRLFPREQFLFIKSEAFFSQPAHVLPKIFSFVGLPNEETINYFPHNVGDYRPLDAAIRQRLAAHFAPHNQRLYQMLGRDFAWETETR